MWLRNPVIICDNWINIKNIKIMKLPTRAEFIVFHLMMFCVLYVMYVTAWAKLFNKVLLTQGSRDV